MNGLDIACFDLREDPRVREKHSAHIWFLLQFELSLGYYPYQLIQNHLCQFASIKVNNFRVIFKPLYRHSSGTWGYFLTDITMEKHSSIFHLNRLKQFLFETEIYHR